MVSKQRHRRARSERAKDLRRRAILEAALHVFRRSTFDEFTMEGVARRARLAKGTLYLYFPTKETLLLTMLEGRLGPMLSDLESSLEADGSPRDPDGAARLIASNLLADEELVRLLMILGPILEANVPEQRIHEFKSWLHRRLSQTGAVLERRLPFLASRSGVRLLLHLQALVCGLGQLARPAPAVARVLLAPEFQELRLDFETELRLALAALMGGLAAALSTERSKGSKKTKGGRHDD
ncbi:MAG: TetR family transcriptional regulator [Thermoanaerobaculia bacterium]